MCDEGILNSEFLQANQDGNKKSYEEYFDFIQAPQKHLVWFKKSAHFPFFEEPEEFAREMHKVLTDNDRAMRNDHVDSINR